MSSTCASREVEVQSEALQVIGERYGATVQKEGEEASIVTAVALFGGSNFFWR